MARLLAIETVDRFGTVSVSENRFFFTHRVLNNQQRSTQSLVPAIQSLLAEAGWPLQTIEVIAVAIGPGSFTGLRVGLATARMLAYVISAKLIGINTLQAIAANSAFGSVWKPEQTLTVAIDAQRGDVVAQEFRLTPSPHSPKQHIPQPIADGQLIAINEWWRYGVNKDNLLYSGSILRKIQHQKPNEINIVDEQYWDVNATGVARIAWERFLLGEYDDLLTLQPYYSRISAAEERRLINYHP